MSRTNQDDYIENMKAMKNTNDDDEYKEENSKHQYGIESDINETKQEKEQIKRLMYMIFKQNVIQYVIDIVTSCGKNDRIGKIK